MPCWLVTITCMNRTRDSISWKGVLYRFAEVEYSSKEDLITGMGAQKNGGRWNFKDSFPVLYASLAPETALAEIKAHYTYYELDFADATPTVLSSLNVDLQHVLDITNGQIRTSLRISRKRMVAEDWRKLNREGKISLTQSIGCKIKEEGYEGILAPSFADPKGHNLIIFLDNISALSAIHIANEQKLPPKLGY